jgi:chromosome segregation ATPase
MLKINQISADVGVDMNIEVIWGRIEQLVKMETESLQDKQTNIYNLQRKVKSLKEQLDSKELHLDLLRKKLGGLEEERHTKTSLEREVDDHVTMSKKLKVKVDKLTQQLTELKLENSDLKAHLQESQNIKVLLSVFFYNAKTLTCKKKFSN